MLPQRRGIDPLTRQIDLLRRVVRPVRTHHPFHIHGGMVLPEHLHCVMELPSGDTIFCKRVEAGIYSPGWAGGMVGALGYDG